MNGYSSILDVNTLLSSIAYLLTVNGVSVVTVNHLVELDSVDRCLSSVWLLDVDACTSSNVSGIELNISTECLQVDSLCTVSCVVPGTL